MIVFRLNSYITLLVLFAWLRFIPRNRFWKLSPILVLGIHSGRDEARSKAGAHGDGRIAGAAGQPTAERSQA